MAGRLSFEAGEEEEGTEAEAVGEGDPVGETMTR